MLGSVDRSGGRPGRWLAAVLVLAACGGTAAPESTGGVAVRSASPAANAPNVAAAAPAAATVVDPIGETAVAVTGAVRDARSSPGSVCDSRTIEALAARHPDAGQWIVVATPSWTSTDATVDVASRRLDGRWACQRSGQTAKVGRSGTRPLADRRSGDGTAPAGVFPLGTTTAWDGQAFQFFGNGPDPGVRGTYRSVRSGDCWGATPGTASYNHLVRSTACSGADDEYLPSITGAYVHAAVIGANNEPDVSGDAPGETPFAAAIFLHRHAYDGATPKATSGCVSLGLDDLVATLALIDPSRSVRFAIGPTDWLRTTA